MKTAFESWLDNGNVVVERRVMASAIIAAAGMAATPDHMAMKARQIAELEREREAAHVQHVEPQQAEQQTPPRVAWTFTEDFRKFIMREENAGEVGFDERKRLWFPHRSHEGGNATIAYGHKLTNSEVDNGRFAKGITRDDALELLERDVQSAYRNARDYVKSIGGDIRIEHLPLERQEMLVDFSYNVGLGTARGLEPSKGESFPRFCRAVLLGDREAAIREGTRHSKGERLGRNDRFWAIYSDPSFWLARTPGEAATRVSMAARLDGTRVKVTAIPGGVLMEAGRPTQQMIDIAKPYDITVREEK